MPYVLRRPYTLRHDAHVAEYEASVVEDDGDYPAYRPCCYCGEEDSPRDSFLDRFICTPCGLDEDDAVALAEHRGNTPRC